MSSAQCRVQDRGVTRTDSYSQSICFDQCEKIKRQEEKKNKNILNSFSTSSGVTMPWERI